MTCGNVYVLKSQSTKHLCKVGRAANLLGRAKTLNTERMYRVRHPYRISFATRHPAYKLIELYAHDLLANRNYAYEMFECSVSEAQTAVQAATGYFAERWTRRLRSNPRSNKAFLEEPAKWVQYSEPFIVDLADDKIARYNQWCEQENERLDSEGFFKRVFASKAGIYSAKAALERQRTDWKRRDLNWIAWGLHQEEEHRGKPLTDKQLLSVAKRKAPDHLKDKLSREKFAIEGIEFYRRYGYDGEFDH